MSGPKVGEPRFDEGSTHTDEMFGSGSGGPSGLFTNTSPDVRRIVPKDLKGRTLVRLETQTEVWFVGFSG